MEIQSLVGFLTESYYVFGICPCCGDVFQLSDCQIRVRHSRVRLPEQEDIVELQNIGERKDDRLGELRDRLDQMAYSISDLRLQLRATKDNAEVIRKKKAGRKQALEKSRKFISLFHRKNLDPRDARLIFSPIEFMVFDGLTEYKEVERLVFLSKRPDNRDKARINKSIDHALSNGNIDFRLIRITDRGTIEYDGE